MTDAELRTRLLTRLAQLAGRLPNGLLHRLVEDAQFFYDWNLGKKKARRSSRISQHTNWEKKADDKYWKAVNSRIG
jgi:hypothetical protein